MPAPSTFVLVHVKCSTISREVGPVGTGRDVVLFLKGEGRLENDGIDNEVGS